MSQEFPEIHLQQLIDVGLNAFAAELLVDSVQHQLVGKGPMEAPLRFTFRGVQVSIQKVADDDKANRRHAEAEARRKAREAGGPG